MGPVVPLAIGFNLASRRGLALGLAAGAFYAVLMGLGLYQGNQLRAWGERERRPVLDVAATIALFVVLIFFTLALLTRWSLLVCFATAAVSGPALLGLAALVRSVSDPHSSVQD